MLLLTSTSNFFSLRHAQAAENRPLPQQYTALLFEHRIPPPSVRSCAPDLPGSSVGFPKQKKLRRGPGHEHAHVGPSPDRPVSLGAGVRAFVRLSQSDHYIGAVSRLLAAGDLVNVVCGSVVSVFFRRVQLRPAPMVIPE